MGPDAGQGALAPPLGLKANSPPEDISNQMNNGLLTMCGHSENTVQAGTPMTVPGEVSLSPWLETGRLLANFIWSKISRGASVGLPNEVGQSPLSVSSGGAFA